MYKYLIYYLDVYRQYNFDDYYFFDLNVMQINVRSTMELYERI